MEKLSFSVGVEYYWIEIYRPDPTECIRLYLIFFLLLSDYPCKPDRLAKIELGLRSFG